MGMGFVTIPVLVVGPIWPKRLFLANLGYFSPISQSVCHRLLIFGFEEVNFIKTHKWACVLPQS